MIIKMYDEYQEDDAGDFWSYEEGDGSVSEGTMRDLIRAAIDQVMAEYGGYEFYQTEPFGRQ